MMKPETKYCKQCRTNKPIEEFKEVKKGFLMEFLQCKKHREYDRNRRRTRTPEENFKYNNNRKRNPEDTRRRNLIRQYNISLEQYEQMLIVQNGVCKICKKPESSIDPRTKKLRKLAVDHCHEGMHIRGLLCASCNVGLGLFKDNVIFLQTAIKYLKDDDEKLANKWD